MTDKHTARISDARAFNKGWTSAGSPMALVLALLLALLMLASLPSVATSAATLPSGFREEVVLDGLQYPTAVRFSPDGRVFVAEKSGVIKVYDSLNDATPDTFADLSTNVHDFWDRGLLGLALDPNFPSEPYVYALYTYNARIGGTAPRWPDSCPAPPGPTEDGCVVSGRLSRLEASGNQMIGDEKVLIEDWCQQYPSHSVGDLAFGRDGALYVSGGDGASFNFADYGQEGDPLNPCGDPPVKRGGAQTPPSAEGGALRSQDLRTPDDRAGLDGAVLRVDPNTGLALPDNPLYATSDANVRRVIAYGFRNPFRIATRPGTDEVWVGNVGWDTYEEIDRIYDPTDSVVENSGWPCYEGAGPHEAYDAADLNLCERLYDSAGTVTAPFYAYGHDEQVAEGDPCPSGGSIAGLTFYEGGSYPDVYDGALFFADYSRRCIWAMREGTDGLPDSTKLEAFSVGAENPVDLRPGPNGDLFYVDILGGAIRRISYGDPGGGVNPCPTGQYRAEYYNNPSLDGTPALERCENGIDNDWGIGGSPGSEVQSNFSARWTGKHDFEAGRYTFSATADDGIRMWVDGRLIIDGWKDQSATTYTSTREMTAGEHEVEVEYYDSGGDAVARVDWEKDTNTPPAAIIDSPSSALKWKVGDEIDFSGSAFDPEDGTLPSENLSWTLIMHHCSSDDGCHQHPVESFKGVASGSFTTPDHEYPSYLELRLTTTDSGGRKDTESVRLDPQIVELNFDSEPSGLQLVVGGTAATTPFSRAVIAGSKNSVSAPSPQKPKGKKYKFDTWSDGGAKSHDITATASTYEATYKAKRRR